jgi:hypothetical protein
MFVITTISIILFSLGGERLRRMSCQACSGGLFSRRCPPLAYVCDGEERGTAMTSGFSAIKRRLFESSCSICVWRAC